MTQTTWPTVAVMGAGAVGCYFGGMLAAAGARVTLIGRAPHVDAIAESGLVIARNDRRDVVSVRATSDAKAVSDADVVLLCVKGPDTTLAAAAMKSHLRTDAVVVSLQNGVDNADRTADIIEQAVLAAVVWVGAYMDGPGVVRHTGRGDLVLGVTRRCADRLHASNHLADVGAMFERAGVPCAISQHIESELWRKLVINCAFNAISAVGRAKYGRMAREPAIRDLMEATVRESVAVANASGIELDGNEMLAKVWATAEALASQHSSTAQDLRRGKATEIDSLNGYVVERARHFGLDVPVNRALYALVKLCETGDDLA